MTVRLDLDALADAADLGDWFEARRPGTGNRFAVALADFVARISAQPRLYGRVARAPRGREVRIGRTRRFPATVVYEVTPTEVVVWSVTHARSRRSPWRRRL